MELKQEGFQSMDVFLSLLIVPYGIETDFVSARNGMVVIF